MKNAIVTLAIGESEIWDYTFPIFKMVCYRRGWDFCVINKRKLNLFPDAEAYNIMFEKFQVVDYFKDYDRVLLIDGDILLSPKYPDIFDATPIDAIGCVYEDKGSRQLNRRARIQQIKLITNDSRLNDWNTGYMNAGMLVYSRSHANALKITSLDDIIKTHISSDQNTVNYLCHRSNHPICDLGYKWNHMSMFSEVWNGAPSRYDSYAIHYAGGARFPGTTSPNRNAEEQRMYLLRKDYAYWWGL